MTKIIRETNMVFLDSHEMRVAAGFGVDRQMDAIQKNRRDANNWYDHKWQNHIEGCLSELAVCHWFEIRWQPNVGVVGALDAGPFEVRVSSYHDGLLSIQKHDGHPDAPYIHTTGKYGVYRIVGFVPCGRDFMTDDFWDNNKRAKGKGPPCYWVPDDRIVPIAGAQAYIEKWKQETSLATPA